MLALLLCAGCASEQGNVPSDERLGRRRSSVRVVHRPRQRERPRLRARQRHVGRLLLSRRFCRPAWRCSTTTTTATSTCTSCRAECSDPDWRRRGSRGRVALRGRSVSQRSRGPRRRHAHAALHRRHRRERDRGARIRHGRRGGRHRQRRLRRSLPDELRAQPAVPQQRRRHVHRRDEGERHRQPAGVRRLGGVRRLRPRRLARPVRRQLRELHASTNETRVPEPGGRPRLLSAADLRRPAAIGCTTTRATARSPT